MSNALELEVVTFSSAVVEQEHGAVSSGEIALQAQNLPTVTQRVPGQHAQLGKGIKNHARRLHFIHLLEHRAGSVSQFDLRRMKNRVLRVWPYVLLLRSNWLTLPALCSSR